MSYDLHKNFGYSLIAVAPVPAASGTTFSVTAGEGTLFPVAPFNIVVWPAGTNPTAANAEVLRVTSKGAGDNWTATRIQESSVARTILQGDQVSAAITAKMITDIETAQAADAAAILLLAPLASPTFTGTAAAPTAAANTNTTQIATTAFVTTAAAAAGRMVLLKQGSGTDTSAGATTVDTIAITGLTAKDRLIVYATIGSTTALTATPRLFNTTDSVTLGTSAGNVTGGTVNTFKWEASQRQSSATSVSTIFVDGVSGTIANVTTAFTTLWTGNWTLGLRHNGVTATGTCDYQWAVYRLTGQ